MNTAKKLLVSRQFWTLVVLFVINGVGAIQADIPAVVLPYVNGVLGLLAIWFRISPKQQF